MLGTYYFCSLPTFVKYNRRERFSIGEKELTGFLLLEKLNKTRHQEENG